MLSARGTVTWLPDECDGGGGAEGGGALGVDELGGGEEDEEERGAHDGGQVHTLFAALGPLRVCGWAAEVQRGGARSGDGRRDAFGIQGSSMRADEGEHSDEKEEIVADDGADEAHLGGGGGEDAVFGELVQAADDHQLKRHEVEDDGGDAEEPLEVDA